MARNVRRGWGTFGAYVFALPVNCLTMATRTGNFIECNGNSIKTTTYVLQYDERIDVRHMVRKKNRSGPTSICQERKKSLSHQWSALYAKLVISIDTELSYCGILLNKYKINIFYYPQNRKFCHTGYWIFD